MCERFGPEPTSSRAAREFVRAQLDLAGEPTWPADLLVSELAANAIEHVGSPFTVHVSVDPVRVSVTDPGPPADLRAVVPDDDAPRGRGLVLLDGLAARWGVTDHPAGGKTVWFELARSDVAS